MGVSGPHCISQVPKVSFLQLVQSNLYKLCQSSTLGVGRGQSLFYTVGGAVDNIVS